MSENPRLRAALELVRLGYPVLPLRPGEKLPLLKGGYKTASTDPQEVRRWWTVTPKANLGVATGELVVIDIDPEGLEWRPGIELRAKAGAITKSPRGGYHLWYRSPEVAQIRCSAGKLAAGVDVRGVGGYIVTPPSSTEKGGYTWLKAPPPLDELPELPQELLLLLEQAQRLEATPLAAANGQPNGPVAQAAPLVSTRLTEALEIISEGRRHSTLVALAGKLRRAGLAAESILQALLRENALRCRPPLPETEVQQICESAAKWAAGRLPEGDGDVALAEVEAKPLAWLWPGRFPLGFVTIVAGRPGIGKSLLALELAARTSVGATWPDRSGFAPDAGVVVINLEDDVARVLKPRLQAAGADLSRIRAVTTPIETFECERIARILDRTPNCRLLIVDPLGNHVGGRTDIFRDNHVREALAPLAELARDRELAIVCVAHLRKSPAEEADAGVLGSTAFTALARGVWHVLPGERPRDGERVLAVGKFNLARPGPGLKFRIMRSPPVLAWGEQLPPEMDADAILAERRRAAKEQEGGRPPLELQEAEEFLKSVLGDGPKLARELLSQARAAGISQATLRRAKEALEIHARKGRDGWTWCPPGNGWREESPASRSVNGVA